VCGCPSYSEEGLAFADGDFGGKRRCWRKCLTTTNGIGYFVMGCIVVYRFQKRWGCW